MSYLQVAPLRVLQVILVFVAHSHIVPSHMMIRTVLVRVGKQGDGSVILLHLTEQPFPCLDSHVDASQLEAHIVRRFDRIILTSNPVQIVQNVLPRGHRGPGISSSLDEHLFELHEHIRVEVG